MQRILRKLLALPPTVLGVITLAFLMLRLTPGDPAEVILGDYATVESVAALRVKLGLDQPLHVQYVRYVSDFVQGDFGRSLQTGQPVLQEIRNVLPHTVRLAVASILVATLFGVPLGFLAAYYRNTLVDRVAMIVTLGGISTPIFVLGFLFLLTLSYRLSLFPLIGVGEEGDFVDIAHHLVLPALTLGLFTGAVIARVTRSSMIEVMNKDYIRTARGKGLPEVLVVGRHALRNALIAIVSVIGLQLAMLLGGTVITETVFSRQGIGKLLVDAILARDYPRVQGVVAVFVTMVIIVNIATDLFYSVLDPRVE